MIDRRTADDADFYVPTTVDGFGENVYAVDAAFGNPIPLTASYRVVRVLR